MKSSDFNSKILKEFRIYSGCDIYVKASTLSNYFNENKMYIKEIILQLHNEGHLLLNDCRFINYDKSSKIRYDFVFDIHIN